MEEYTRKETLFWNPWWSVGARKPVWTECCPMGRKRSASFGLVLSGADRASAWTTLYTLTVPCIRKCS
jgi:hypothetical protein